MECARCHRHHSADARFCSECGARLATWCPSCGVRNPASHVACSRCGAPLGPDAPAALTDQAAPPEHRTETIRSPGGVLERERKQVTVLFADMKGSMELVSRRDPEEVRTLLDPLLELMMEAVHRYEGTVNQVMGDGIMALFGAPLAHEDHAVRACYAALRIRHAVTRYAETLRRSHGIDVQVRMGLNSGEVVVRAIDSDVHMDYTAVGQAAHLAARMEQLASPGSICLTTATLGLAEGHIEVRPLGRLPVKGLAEPVEVYELADAARIRTRWQARAARGLSQFISRDVELARLRRALHEAEQGQGQVVAVVGEPGVGKSRLVYEFVHAPPPPGWLRLECGAVSYGKETAYLPVSHLLRAYFQIEPHDDTHRFREKVTSGLLCLDPSLASVLPALLTLLDVPTEDVAWERLHPAERRDRILDAITRVLLRESQRQPLLLVVEDVQWIDSETQAALDALVRALAGARILLLVNYRPEYRHGWAGEPRFTELALEPFGPESAEDLLRAVLGDDSGLDALKRLLFAQTAGNPFFLEESVRTLVEAGTLVGELGAYRLGAPVHTVQVPATVQAVLSARLDRLSPPAKHLLQSAAVIGRDVPLMLLRAVAHLPEPELGRHLAHLLAAGFLAETGRVGDEEYAFTHALTHEVAYRSLLQERRRLLHAGIVDAIERLYAGRLPEHVERLAHHAVRGQRWDRAVTYLHDAGTRAFAKGLVEESLTRYEDALSLTAHLPDTDESARRAIDLRVDLHTPLVVLGRLPGLDRLHVESEALARKLADPLRLGGVLYCRAQYAWMDGRYRDGLACAAQALDIAHKVGDDRLRVLATYNSAVHLQSLGQYRAAIDHFLRVVQGRDAELARRVLAVTVPAFIAAAGWLGQCLTHTGDLEQALAWTAHAVDAAETFQHPQALVIACTLRAIPLAHHGELRAAVALCERAVDLCMSKKLVVWFPAACSTLGWTLAASGQPAAGVPYLERATTMLEGLGVRTHLARMYTWLGEALLAEGRLDEASRAAQRAIELAQACEERGHEAEACRLAAALAAVADPAGAISRYAAAEALAGTLGMRPLQARCWLDLGIIHRRLGQAEAAEERLWAALAIFRQSGMPAFADEADRALSRAA